MLDILRRVWRSPSGRIGLVATLIVVLGGLLAPVIATHLPNQIDVANRLTPPSASHWLGADNLGRDLYSRGLYGTRVAVGVALAVTATALVLGIFLGVAAAYAPSPIESTDPGSLRHHQLLSEPDPCPGAGRSARARPHQHHHPRHRRLHPAIRPRRPRADA